MCGIGGWLGLMPEGEKFAARMQQTLHHRGPDAYGIKSWNTATLVHTRLSIIDLSPNGAQPMANEDASIWTVFNGEIYNHKELHRSLESRGHIFKGHSDTEVLPHLYEEDGPDFLTRLRGMFALAIYDTRTQTMILARDRFGIKPLFYAPRTNRIAFASEIRALLGLPGINDQPDRQAIFDFAALFYIPAPATFYAGIRALQPGEMLEATLNVNRVSYTIRKYHKWAIAPDSKISLSDAVDRADELVTAAVKSQLESDVPIGALLSGGIDSSLVSAAAQAALDGRLRTFNARFPDKAYDESWAATAVAEHIKSSHLTLEMDVQGTWDHVTDLLKYCGQPFADTSLFAVNAICRLMRQHVSVALSGDGGDEGFGGYNFYRLIEWIARWQKIPVPIELGVSFALSPLARLGVIPERLPQQLRGLSGVDDTSVIQTLFCWIREEEHRLLCRDTSALPVRRLFESQWECYLPVGASRLERLSAHATEVNARLVLPNDFLFKVDTASMKESLEIRVPMLDEKLFSYGLSLPHRLKVDNGMCKRVLRALAKRKLPSVIADKPKRGFEIPVDTWVDDDFRIRLRDVLLGPSSRLPEFFHPEFYGRVVEAFCDRRPCPGISRQGLYQRAIMLLSVQLAMDHRVV
jgi:asparagine synthase (glutamine-hydrolysing)